MNDAAEISRCIAGCMRARDGRVVGKNQAALQRRLVAAGSTPTIARLTAQACARVAEVIKRERAL